MIVYLLGVLMGILAVMDVFRTSEFGIPAKIIVPIVILVFSWIGVFAYYYAIKPIYIRTRRG